MTVFIFKKKKKKKITLSFVHIDRYIVSKLSQGQTSFLILPSERRSAHIIEDASPGRDANVRGRNARREIARVFFNYLPHFLLPWYFRAALPGCNYFSRAHLDPPSRLVREKFAETPGGEEGGDESPETFSVFKWNV